MNEVKVTIPYRIDGERKELHVTVDFVSKRSLDEFNTIMSQAASVKAAWEVINELTAKISALETEKPEGYKEERDQARERIKAKIKEIESIDINDFESKRINLVCKILHDNGVTDEKFFDNNFWLDCVNVTTIYDFLETVIYKDIDLKKK